MTKQIWWKFWQFVENWNFYGDVPRSTSYGVYMVMFLVLHPMESISLNSFVLLEHLAMLLTSTLAINC